MIKYRVKKGFKNGTPVKEWSFSRLYYFFKDKYLEEYGVKSRNTMGEFLRCINSRSMAELYRLEGLKKDVHPKELLYEYVEWLFGRNRNRPFNVNLYGYKGMMTDFLIYRSTRIGGGIIGTSEEFKAQEEARRKEAERYFNND